MRYVHVVNYLSTYVHMVIANRGIEKLLMYMHITLVILTYIDVCITSFWFQYSYNILKGDNH